MRKICVIMGGVLPVPAVCGGAIETLVTSIVKRYSAADGISLTVCSVWHPEAERVAKNYPEVRFFWTHTRSVKNLFLHALFLGIRLTTGKCIRPLQRHYNEIAKLFAAERFDLILAEGGDTQAIADIAKGYGREQFANHIHIHYLPPENIVRSYGHMIGVSEFVTREYLAVCKLPVSAHTLKNAIDTEKFKTPVSAQERRAIREQLGFCAEDFVLLFVGRMMQIKGVLELMQTVIDLPDKRVKLMIMGSANSGKRAFSAYERRVRTLAEKHRDRIVFTGYVDNAQVCKYAAAADVQCLPTLVEEAAPLVVLEAMTEGLPLIVTRSGGVTEYVDESVAKIIEKENLKDHLRDAVCELQAHPEVRAQMSACAVRKSEAYGEETYYRNFIALVRQILEENGGGHVEA